MATKKSDDTEVTGIQTAAAVAASPADKAVLSRRDRIARFTQRTVPPGQVAGAKPGIVYFGIDTAAPEDVVKRQRQEMSAQGYDPLEKPHDEYVVGVPTAELWWMTQEEYAAKESAKNTRR